MFVRCVNIVKVRSEADCVNAFNCLTQKPAFQSCVNGVYFRFVSGNFFISCNCLIPYGRIGIIFPCGIFRNLFEFGICTLGLNTDNFASFIKRAFYAASYRNGKFEFTVFSFKIPLFKLV